MDASPRLVGPGHRETGRHARHQQATRAHPSIVTPTARRLATTSSPRDEFTPPRAAGTTDLGLSKKQKLTVKGNVTGVTVTPIIAPTAAPPEAPGTPLPPSAKPK
jgi:hypothetical protein